MERPEKMSEDTKAKIAAVIKKTNYRPSIVALDLILKTVN